MPSQGADGRAVWEAKDIPQRRQHEGLGAARQKRGAVRGGGGGGGGLQQPLAGSRELRPRTPPRQPLCLRGRAVLTQRSSHHTTSSNSPLQLLASSQQEPPHVYIDGAGLQAAVTEAVQAALAPVQQQLAELQEGQAQLQEGQAQLLEMVTRTENGRRRNQNTRTLRLYPLRVLALEPLAREQPAGADTDAAAVGALPPPGTFPRTWRDVEQVVGPCCGLMSEERCAAQRAGRVQALQLSTHVARRWPPLPAMQITHAQLDALAAFYGEEFGAPGERTFCRYLSRPANTHAVHGCRVPLGLSHAGCCGNACMLRHPGSWDTPGAHRMPLPVWLHLQVVCSGAKPSPTSSPRTRSLDRSW